MRTGLVILCVVAMSACSRAGFSVPPAAAPQLMAPAAAPQVMAPAAVPDAMRIAPLTYFTGGKNGTNAIGEEGGVGGLIGDPRKALYGTASEGGYKKTCSVSTESGCGVVFMLTPQAGTSTYKEMVLHRFSGSASPPDGAEPFASLVMDSAGNLYGTTKLGGRLGFGTVFTLNSTGSGFSVLYSFKGGRDASYPVAPLVLDKAGELYGTTTSGGNTACACGTVFELETSGKGYTTLHSFAGTAHGDGSVPVAGLSVDKSGALYGTTREGGSVGCDCGTVFKLTPSGQTYTEQIIHVFGAMPPDGQYPEAGVLVDKVGRLYGTTTGYRKGVPKLRARDGFGAIYALTPAGSSYTEQIVHIFTMKAALDGLLPQSPLVFGPYGFLYGTTTNGGSMKCDGGCGVIYRFSRPQWKYRVVNRFAGGQNGGNPSPPLLYAHDSLYGEALSGGAYTFGFAFRFTL